MKIRFYHHKEDDFTLEVKKWYGWQPIYKYGGAFCISERFKSKKEGIDYLKQNMKKNPLKITILEYPMIIVRKP